MLEKSIHLVVLFSLSTLLPVSDNSNFSRGGLASDAASRFDKAERGQNGETSSIMMPRQPSISEIQAAAEARKQELVDFNKLPMSSEEMEAITKEVLKEFHEIKENIVVITSNYVSDSSEKGSTKLILIDSRSGQSGPTKNCMADAHSKQIECDMAYIDSLIFENGLATFESIESQVDRRADMFAIVLLHELGHIHHGHSGLRRYHEDREEFSIFEYAKHEAELEADQFAAEQLNALADSEIPPHVLLFGLTQAAVARASCPDTFPSPCAWPCPDGVDFSNCRFGPSIFLAFPKELKFELRLEGTHPAAIVRYARMLALSPFIDARAFDKGKSARDVLERIEIVDKRDQRLSFGSLLAADSVQGLE